MHAPAIETVVVEFLHTMSILSEIYDVKPPEQLYHYTSFGGFIGICQSRAIWASNIHHLNDSQEFAHGRSLVQHEITNRLRERNLTSDDRAFLEVLSTKVKQIRNVHVFVASFSETGDLLSQWRGYCPPGKGISVGVLSRVLVERGTEQGFTLARAIYDFEKQSRAMRELVDEVLRKRTDAVADDETLSTFLPTMLL
jgi:hypothetical protein